MYNGADKDWIKLGTDIVDVDAIMGEINTRVDKKKKDGVYDRYNLEGFTNLDVEDITKEEDFLKYYLDVLQHTCDIDIGDFQIPSKGGLLGKPIAKLKRVIWILLRFYTYRLFSQQKEFNFQVVNTLLSLNKKLEEKVQSLEKRIAELEKQG